MYFESKLAWRYFRARRKSLARFTSLAAIIGIAGGVASLILAQALARGFSDEMQDKILSNTAHVSVFTTDGAEIANWREIKSSIEKSANVKDVAATNFENAIIAGTRTMSYAVLRAIENRQFPPVSREPSENGEQLAKIANPPIRIGVGKELAEKSGLKIGDRAEIILIENENAPKTAKVAVQEIFQTGLYDYDATWIYTSPEDFARLKARSFTPTLLSISVRDVYKSDETADEIRRNLNETFKIVDWQQANQPLFAALSLERKVALAIISLVIFIAALNITTTLALLVNERRLDIAVLRTCGAKARQLTFVFLIEGLFLGFLGIFSGVILGLSGCFLANRFKIINLSAEVYSLSYIPLRPNLESVLAIIFAAFLLCLAATAYPAYKASRIKPLENLRQQ